MLSKVYFKLGKKLKFLPTSPVFAFMHFFHLDELYLKRKFSKYLKYYSKNITDIVNFRMKYSRQLVTGLAPYELEFMLKKIDETKNLKGDILELGTHKGGSTILLAKYLLSTNDPRKIYAADWFKGLPYSDEFGNTDEKKQAKGRLTDTSKEFVEKKFKQFKVDDKIIIIDGLFEETLYKKLNEHIFSFVFIDCDLYKSAKFALEYIDTHLENDGIVFLHDYSNFLNRPKYDWGIIKAADEYVSKHKVKFTENPIAHFQKFNSA